MPALECPRLFISHLQEDESHRQGDENEAVRVAELAVKQHFDAAPEQRSVVPIAAGRGARKVYDDILERWVVLRRSRFVRCSQLLWILGAHALVSLGACPTCRSSTVYQPWLAA